jgi:predicted nuclease of predicted toxin-antitoxin system
VTLARLVLDQNLAPRLVKVLAERFPGSVHVRDRGMDRASDDDVWAFARHDGTILVSKDADFVGLASLHGPPPKVVWLRCGNESTETIADLLRRHADDIEALATSPESILVIG